MAARLTDVERAERKVLEIDLQRQLVGKDGLAPMLGWEHVHFRPGMRANGQWRTATSGSLAHWPDLVLVRPRDRRLIFAELKRELEQASVEQQLVLRVLSAVGETYVWRPSDLRDPIEQSAIYEVLR